MRIMMRDESLPHQIVLLVLTDGSLAVSCNCMRTMRGHKPFEARKLWQDGEALAVYERAEHRLTAQHAQMPVLAVAT